MPNIQIKGVPERTHAVLRERAAGAHQSLQEYLLTKLIDDASRPTSDEIFDRSSARGGPGFTFSDAVDALESERARR